mmetsp:Transcript_29438/g.74875  ORF Transcript_29438/g.74875 Transcript_29438/m.74875 type:complete len:217 (+) Transcript_29438:885-1535(+)
MTGGEGAAEISREPPRGFSSVSGACAAGGCVSAWKECPFGTLLGHCCGGGCVPGKGELAACISSFAPGMCGDCVATGGGALCASPCIIMCGPREGPACVCTGGGGCGICGGGGGAMPGRTAGKLCDMGSPPGPCGGICGGPPGPGCSRICGPPGPCCGGICGPGRPLEGERPNGSTAGAGGCAGNRPLCGEGWLICGCTRVRVGDICMAAGAPTPP